MLGAKESFQDDGAEGKNKGESYEQDGLRAGKLLGERCSFEVLLELFEVHDDFLSNQISTHQECKAMLGVWLREGWRRLTPPPSTYA